MDETSLPSNKKIATLSSGELTRQQKYNIEQENRYTCSFCEKYFTHSSSLDIHKMSHTGDKLYDSIQRDYSTSGGLKKHKLSQTGEKQFVCSQCKALAHRREIVCLY